MPKKILQDIKIKVVDRNIRPKSTPREIPIEPVHMGGKIDRDLLYRNSDVSMSRGRSGGKAKYSLWFLAVVCLIALFFAVSFFFQSATVTVNAKVSPFTLNQNFSATKDAEGGALAFSSVILEGTETKNIEAGGVRDVSESAKGNITLYNAFSTSPQVLAKDTRLTGSNNKIYKLSTKVTIPGMKGTTPGKVDADIYASEAGEAYNSDPLDFNVLGFKGTPKYSKIYGRSNGQISGGFVGKQSVVSELDKAGAVNELKATLKEKLFKKVNDQIPPGYILYKDAVFFTTEEEDVGTAIEDGTVPVTLKGTFYGFLFEEKNLTAKIIENVLPKHDGSPVTVLGIRDLQFTLSKDTSPPNKDTKNLNFSLKGDVKVVWTVDAGKIQEDLLGAKKVDFNQIMSNYTSIESADLSLIPIWTSKMPEKGEDIEIIVNYPK